ncbi:hypothetical protein V3481_000018 [Fusarium oxysporum f. sp. vasinfectum]
MHRYEPRKGASHMLPGQAAVRLPPRTVAGGSHQAQPVPTDLELRPRQFESDTSESLSDLTLPTGSDLTSVFEDNLTTGTLTITVAPDATCGFDGRGSPGWICPSSRRCSWESSDLGLAFCGFAYLATTCIDRTAYTDTDLCDSACLSNTLNGFCTESGRPSCMEIGFGDVFSTWVCGKESTSYSFDTTQDLGKRDFRTLVVFDGTVVGTSSSVTTTHNPPNPSTPIRPTPPGPNVGAIVGGVIGGLAFIGLAALGVLYFRRRHPRPDPYPTPQIQQVSHQQPEYLG